jgi:hypothetical protein
MVTVESCLILPFFIKTWNSRLLLNQGLDAHVSSSIVRASRTK